MADIDTVLERLVTEREFREQLQSDPAAALAGYDLTEEDLEVLAASLDESAGGDHAVEQRTSKSAFLAALTGFVEGGADEGPVKCCAVGICCLNPGATDEPELRAPHEPVQGHHDLDRIRSDSSAERGVLGQDVFLTGADEVGDSSLAEQNGKWFKDRDHTWYADRDDSGHRDDAPADAGPGAGEEPRDTEPADSAPRAGGAPDREPGDDPGTDEPGGRGGEEPAEDDPDGGPSMDTADDDRGASLDTADDEPRTGQEPQEPPGAAFPDMT